MDKKKKWFAGCAVLLVCAALAVVCASIFAAGTEKQTVAHESKSAFSDVQKGDWFYDDVQYVKENGLMSGTDATAFSPNQTMSRAMVVTVLWRLEGQPAGGAPAFRDVKSDAYYYRAVAWASANKIVSGYDESTFGADDDVTREQLAAILQRYAEQKGYAALTQADLSKFTDTKDISDYAVRAVAWAVADGLITGTSESTISPQGNALRCQVAAVLRRFCTRYDADEQAKPKLPEPHTGTSGDTGKTGGGQTTPSTHGVDKPDTKTDGDLPYITIDNATAAPGDKVQIVAEIKQNPGILGMTLLIDYDMNNLTLERAENGDATSGVLDMTTSKTLFSGARFVWDGIEIKPNDIRDGALLRLYFRIPDNAKAGKYPITLHYERGDIVDNNLDTIDVAMETGYITVQK